MNYIMGKNYAVQLFGFGLFATTHYYLYQELIRAPKHSHTQALARKDIPPPRL